MPAMGPGWGWRLRAAWWRLTPGASRWKTAPPAKRPFALRCRNRSRLYGGGRLLPTEDVHVDVLEQPDQGRGRIPGAPPAAAVPEDDFGVECLTQVACERRGDVAPVEADELPTAAMHQGGVLAEPAAFRFGEPRRANADHRQLRRRARAPGRHPLDARLHARTRWDAGDQARPRLPGLFDLPLAHVRHQ